MATASSATPSPSSRARTHSPPAGPTRAFPRIPLRRAPTAASITTPSISSPSASRSTRTAALWRTARRPCHSTASRTSTPTAIWHNLQYLNAFLDSGRSTPTPSRPTPPRSSPLPGARTSKLDRGGGRRDPHEQHRDPLRLRDPRLERAHDRNAWHALGRHALRQQLRPLSHQPRSLLRLPASPPRSRPAA